MIHGAFRGEAILAREPMSDADRACFEQRMIAIRGPGGRRPADHRRAQDGIFRIARYLRVSAVAERMPRPAPV